MANYLRALGYPAGLGCCGCMPSRPLAGYLRKTLQGYRAVALSGLGDTAIAPGTPALLPVSDKQAIANAIRMFQVAGGSHSGVSDAAQAQSAASGAAAGAKVGSIVPGVGTVIGAVVGAVVGWLATKKKPVRATAQQIAACRSSLADYMSYARQMPSQPIPLERDQLIDLNWCVQSIYGADIGLRDPRWFNPGFVDGLMPIARQIVRKIYETPVGKSVDLATFQFRDPKGRVLTFKGFSFINPQFVDLKTFSDRYFFEAALEFCRNTAGKGAGGCEKLMGHEEWRRLLYDLIAWAARQELPNISEADLKAASAVAAQTGSAAKDVVSAVEQIIGRNVERGETAALLTNSSTTTAPPPTAPPPPTVQPDIVPAPVTPTPVDEVIRALPAPVIRSVPAPRLMPAPSAVLPITQAGAGSQTPLLLGAAALLFALAYPRRRRANKVTP